MPELWPHQVYGINAVADVCERTPNVCLTCPTGGGKTRVMQELIRGEVGDVALYTDRKMLLAQIARVLDENGIEYGLRAAGHKPALLRRVQLSMMQTEGSRSLGNGRDVHTADFVVIDEAHKMAADTMMALDEEHLRLKPNRIKLGFTATPLGIGHFYDELIIAGTNSELRECGALVPAYHYAPDEPDTKWIGKVKVDGGECGIVERKRTEYAHRVFGRVLEHIPVYNPELRPMLLFAPGVAQSKWFAQELTRHGIPSAHIAGDGIWIDGHDIEANDENRAYVAEASESGLIKCVCNRFIAREGINWPWLYHGIFATVFGSLTSYIQAGGRLLRNHPSMDHVCVSRGTLITTDRGDIPIEQVQRDDLIWDGVEWCFHNGACCNGVRKVIEWNGVTLTPNHKVLTHDGWKEAQEAKVGGWRPIIGAFGGSPIRTSDHSNPRHQGVVGQTGSTGRLQPVRKTRMEEIPPDFPKNAAWLRALHAGIRQTLPGMAMASCPAPATAVPVSAKQHVLPIWWERNRIPLLVDLRGSMLDCGEPRSTGQERHDSRPYRQQRPLRAGEPEVGRSVCPSTQPGVGLEGTAASEISLRRLLRWQFDSTQETGIVAQTDSRQVEVEVWDIVNAGPRNRYCANGLLVANCVQDHGANWWRHGSLNADRQWVLGYDDRIVQGLRKQRLQEKKEPEPITCPKCNAVRLHGKQCPECGYQHAGKVRSVLQKDGRLREMRGDIFRRPRRMERSERIEKQWISRVWAVRKSKKDTVKDMTFAQVEANFAREHKWFYPPRTLPQMPLDPADWFRPIKLVAMERLTR